MAEISREVVTIGDKVWDILWGQGEVYDTDALMIKVKFSDGTKANFTTGGKYNNQVNQRLFWHNPIFFDPPKNLILVQAVQQIAMDTKERLVLYEKNIANSKK